MAVDGGTVDAGLHIAQHPLYLAATVIIAIGLVISILYVADFQDVEWRTGSRGRAAAACRRHRNGTCRFRRAPYWVGAGRVVDRPRSRLRSACICAVAFVPMAIGAALGDILPGN